MTDELGVWFAARPVARALVEADGRLGLVYDRSWLDSADAFALSLRLPLRPEPYPATESHAFFANLLPEGAVRTAVCRRLGLSEDNDVALLRAIGGECAGALSIRSAGSPAPATEPRYKRLDDRRLRKLVAEGDVALLAGGEPTRLSLAGAQDKVPVAVFDGRLHLPLDASPSTHILKLPNARYPHLTANEGFVLGLAVRLGLQASSAELIRVTEPPCLLVERYDRVATGRAIRRLHQEDLCQALGVPPGRKYEQEGGPSLAAVIELVRSHVREPLGDVRRLIQWQAFNVVAGNSDGHAKNLAVVYDGTPMRLAPFYDLVSTREYRGLDRNLAMTIGGHRNPDEITVARWSRLAEMVQIGPRVVLDLVRGVCERTLDVMDSHQSAFVASYGRLPILQTLPGNIRKRARRALRALV